MFKFIKKSNTSHYKDNKIVITYSMSEIVLGAFLVGLVAFYIYNYFLQQTTSSVGNYPISQPLNNQTQGR